MVAYLKKTEGSEGFHQIVDFLNASHIQYALTKNPTIYVSPIQQFWQTATARTLDNGELEITATIDGKVKTVTEVSIRRHIKLEDSDGISNLPTTEIFSQLALMGSKKTSWEQFSSNIATAIICLATNRKFNFSKLIFDGMGEGSTVLVESHHTPTGAPSTSQPHLSPTLRSSIRQETEVPQPSSPPHTNVADEAASTGVDVRYGGAATTVTSLDAGQGSGNIDKTPSMPHDSPLLRGHTLGSDEGRMQHNELMDLVTKLSDRVVALETDLQQTKKVYGAAFTKLIKKVKRLEKKDKLSKSRRKARIVFNFDFNAAKEVSTTEPVSTAGAAVTTASVVVSTVSPTRVSTIDDIASESLVYLLNDIKSYKRYQEEEGKDYQCPEEASSFNVKEWEDIQARVEADEELAQRILKELEQESSKRQKTGESTEPRDKEDDELSQDELQQMMIIVLEQGMNVEALQTKYLIIDKISTPKVLGSTKKIIRVGNHIESEGLFEPDKEDELWKLQKPIHDLTWKLYDSCGVHHVSTKTGIDLYMLVEKEYPLSRGVLTQMLVAKLLVKQDNEISIELLRKEYSLQGRETKKINCLEESSLKTNFNSRNLMI
ncbi:hypothetical protein Tco_0283103 [Tanacetum coccineum]